MTSRIDDPSTPEARHLSETAPREDDPIDLLLRESVRLPSFPDVLLRLDEELRREAVDLPKVSHLVGMDPVLSGQLLRMANSAWYSRGGKPIQDLTRAMIRLGLPSTRDLVHALLMPSFFPGGSGALDLGAYWKHSFAVALFAQAIGRRLDYSRERMDTLWTAGLLHDIGAVLYDIIAPEPFGRLLRNVAAAPSESESAVLDFSQMERDWLGADHAALGAAFLERSWKLPAEIVLCIRQHESPVTRLQMPEVLPLVLPIHIADVLCEERGVAWVPERARKTPDLSWSWNYLGLSGDAVASMMDDVDRALEQAESLLASGR